MHDLVILLIGITIGSLCSLALISLMHQAHDADRWGEELHNWDGGSTFYDWTKENPTGLSVRRRDPGIAKDRAAE